jgi:precorrin-8X/cobalt-precorrin-8 methylmutase
MNSLPIFDSYLIVDWSANSKPKRGEDSIWICEGSGKAAAPPQNPSTRIEALESIREILRGNVAKRLVTLVGFDFPYGYPHGLAEAAAAPGRKERGAWRSMWDLIASQLIDGIDNGNNRFDVAEDLNITLGKGPGPYWGCHPSRECARLRKNSPPFPFPSVGAKIDRFRHVEKSLRARGYEVQETWKLFGNGSVGSQTLTGLPRLVDLRDDPLLRECSLVWPFETRFTRDPTLGRRPIVVHAEIWPSVREFPPREGEVKDESQVRGLAEYFASLDSGGRLGSLFERPTNLSDEAAEDCVSEEGWILGAP